MRFPEVCSLVLLGLPSQVYSYNLRFDNAPNYLSRREIHDVITARDMYLAELRSREFLDEEDNYLEVREPEHITIYRRGFEAGLEYSSSLTRRGKPNPTCRKCFQVHPVGQCPKEVPRPSTPEPKPELPGSKIYNPFSLPNPDAAKSQEILQQEARERAKKQEEEDQRKIDAYNKRRH